MKQLLSILSIAIMLASCNSQYDKTSTGLAYKIIKGDGKKKLKSGDVLKINGVVKIKGSKDTTLFTSYGRLPEYMPYDTTTRKTHDFTEVLKYCSVGDSIIAIAQVDTMVKMQLMQYNETFKKGDQITYNIKVVNAFTDGNLQRKDQEMEIENEKKRENATIEAALKKKGIQAVRTENGAYVQVTNAGNSSIKPVLGKQVTVMYKGSLLDNGKVFDSNMEPSFGHPQPLSFVIGAGRVIRGWDEAIPYFGKGGSGTIYVPALLGYGPPGQPPVIPGYATLVFEVRVLDVTDAPKQDPQAQMPPGGDPRQQQGGQQQQGGDPRQQQGNPQQQAPPPPGGH